MNKDYNNRLLISSSAKDTIKDSVKLAQELKTGIEISRIPLYKNKELTLNDTIEILKNDLEGFEGRKTLHAMFSDVNISSQDVELRAVAQKRCMQSYEIGKAIGTDTILFHTGNKGTKHYGSIKSFKKNFIIFWQEFIKEFERNKITAVIENVFETEPKFCLDLYNGVNSEYFKLALDTGHVNLYAKETKVTDWIKAYGDNLYHLHIHNNFGTNDDHSNLENGEIDFKGVFDEIKRQKINPTFVLEMFSENDIRKSVETYNKLMF